MEGLFFGFVLLLLMLIITALAALVAGLVGSATALWNLRRETPDRQPLAARVTLVVFIVLVLAGCMGLQYWTQAH